MAARSKMQFSSRGLAWHVWSTGLTPEKLINRVAAAALWPQSWAEEATRAFRESLLALSWIIKFNNIMEEKLILEFC